MLFLSHLLIHLFNLCCDIDTFDLRSLTHIFHHNLFYLPVFICDGVLALVEFLKNKECIVHAIFWIITSRSSHSWPERDKDIPEFLSVVFAMKRIWVFIPAVPCLLGNTLFISQNRCSIICAILMYFCFIPWEAFKLHSAMFL